LKNGEVIKTGHKTYLRLLKYATPYWFTFILGALAMLVYALTDTGFAYLIKTLTDNFAGITDGAYIGEWKLNLSIVVIVIFIIRGISGFFSVYNIGWIGRQVIKALRGEVFAKFLYLPTSFLDHKSNAELLSKVTFNIEQVAESTSNTITILIRDTLTILALTAYMIYLSPRLAGVIFLVAPIIALIVRFLGKLFRRYSERIQDSMGDVTHLIKETLQNHRIIKIFNGQDYENEKFERVNEGNRKHNMKLFLTKAIGDAVTIFVASLGVAGVVYVATLGEVKDMEIGNFTGFITAMVLLMTPLKRLTNVNAMIQRGIAASASIFLLIDEANEIDDGEIKGKDLVGKIEFKNVSFAYDKGLINALTDIDLTIQPGENIAIVGKSGSGKTTLVNLLPRFYDITEGKLFINGIAVNDYTLNSLRNNISLVTQEVILFNDTILNNVAYGSFTEEETLEAISAANMDEFVDKLAEGLQTKVGDEGILLSGGQRQRIAIARALLKDAPILILDEATSALDTESERYIQNALEKLMQDRTTLVIAHRLSTVEKADRIIVLADGEIIESGSHKELITQEGEYALLHRLQFNDET
jgi:subfamily B ATP-binding cassette protein MsbA